MTAPASNTGRVGSIQPAYRPEELLPVSAFRAYCKERDVSVEDFQLEYFEQVRLMLPAVRIRLGIAQTWNTPHGLHYLPHGYHYGSKDWLEPFKRRGDLLLPAREVFRPWAELRPPMTDLFTPPPHVHETFYDRSQLFIVEQLQDAFGMQVRAEGYLAKPAAQREWSRVGETLARWFAGQPGTSLRLSLAGLGRFLDVFLAARDLVRSGLVERETIWRQFKTRPNRSRGIQGALGASRDRLAREARNVMAEGKTSQAELERWRTHFAAHSHLRDRGVFAWVKHLRDDPTSNDTRVGKQTRLALAYFDVAEWLTYFLGFLGAEPLPTELVVGEARPQPVKPFWSRWEQPVLHSPRRGRRRTVKAQMSVHQADPFRGPVLEKPASLEATPSPAVRRDVGGERIDLQAPSPGANVWQREGEVWLVRFGDDAFRVRHTVGLAYLAYLIRRPAEECAVEQMIRGVRGAETPEASALYNRMTKEQLANEGLVVNRVESFTMIDATASTQYRGRLAEIDQELGEAKRTGNADRIHQLQEENELLMRELRSEAGRRRRGVNPGSDRARKAVWAAIRRARRDIQKHSAALASHLFEFVTTGRRCAYRPPQPVDWSVKV